VAKSRHHISSPFYKRKTIFYSGSKVKASRNGPERRSDKRVIAGTAFRLEFLVGWYYDADATMAVPELY